MTPAPSWRRRAPSGSRYGTRLPSGARSRPRASGARLPSVHDENVSVPLPAAQPSLSETVEAAFERLVRELGFERREGQLAMAARWSEALERGGTLAVEAPTGIGKSLAYLIPAITHRTRGSGPILVSTHTKALQDQLVRADAPLAFAATGAPLRALRLLGRASYLCRRRARARLAQRRLFANEDEGPGGFGPD